VNLWTVSIIWLIALLCLKYYKDKVIYLQKERIETLEAKWTRGQKKKL